MSMRDGWVRSRSRGFLFLFFCVFVRRLGAYGVGVWRMRPPPLGDAVTSHPLAVSDGRGHLSYVRT